MKRFTAILAALMVMALIAVPASADDVVEIRSIVLNGTNFSDLFSTYGAVIDGVDTLELNENNFGAFFYDLDDGKATETIRIINTTADGDVTDREILENALIYNSTIDDVEFEENFTAKLDQDGLEVLDTYPIVGFFAQKYVPLTDTDASKLTKLLIDSDDKYTLRTGSSLELPNGYALTAKQIDVEGNKVWMELSKDGEFVEDQVIDLFEKPDVTWRYETDVEGETDVEVFRVKVTDVFQGQVDSLAVVEGIWLIDYENVMEIENGDEFGELEVIGTPDTSIVLKNKENEISLTKDKVIDIAEDLKFRVANDGDTLRFYLFVERVIEGGDAVEVVDGEPTEEEMPVEEEAEEEVAEEEVAEEEVAEEEVAEEEAEEEEEEPVEESPGFESIFAVAGLLAVAYLVRRN